MKLTKAEYEASPATVQSKFTVVEGSTDYSNAEENVDGLKTALEKEKAQGKQNAIDRDAYKTKVDASAAATLLAEQAKDRKSGDFTKIEQGYKDKIATLEADKIAGVEANNLAVANLAEVDVIKDISSIFSAPGAMGEMVKARLVTTIEDGKAITRVLAKDGTASAMSPADLKKEFVDNKEYAPIIAASKGNGGGATVPKEGGGSTSTEKFDASSADPKDMVAHLEAKGVGGEVA